MTPAKSAAALDLLMDMEIPIQIRFAGTTILLRDALALDAGSAVVFDKAADDPVDVVVNGQVIARGAVVMVAGNYGVRITEITHPAEIPDSAGENA